jgi:tetratricopeptide (TPR) repeat protein
MRTTRWAAAVLLATVWLSSAGMAEAQGKSEAEFLFKEGNQLYQQQRYDEALAKYQAAYAQQPRLSILLNIAATLERLDRLIEAAEAYQRYVEHPKTKPDKKTRAQEALSRLEKKLARIEVQPAGATISVDGHPVEQVPEGGLRLVPGSHTVTVEKKGYRPVSLEKQFNPGKPYTIELLAAPEVSEELDTERLRVSGREKPEREPLPGQGALPETAETAQKPIKEAPPPGDVTRPPETTAAPPPGPSVQKKTSKVMRNAAIGVGAAAFASFATGVALIGSVYPDYNRLRRECPLRGGCAAEEIRGPQLRANLGYAFLAIGGAAAVADIVLAVKAARQGRRERARKTSWWIAPAGTGVAAGGAF